MSYAPDYGLALMNLGLTKADSVTIYQFHLGTISVLDDGTFSTTLNSPIGDEWHAMTVDFDADQFRQMLATGPEENARFICDRRVALAFQQTFDLPKPFEVDVTLALGELLSNANEQYVPLKVIKVLAADERTQQTSE